MGRGILRLLAVLLVAGAVAGGAFGSARRLGGEAGYASDLMTIAPAASALSVAPILPVVEVVPTPPVQPPPAVEPTPQPPSEPPPELTEEPAAAPGDGDAEPSAVVPPVFAAAAEPEPPPSPALVDPATLEAAVVAGINARRVAAGLSPLQLDPTLVAVAGERSRDMVQRGYFSHVSPTGETYVSLLERRGVACSWCGENIAYNNYPDDQTVAVVLSSWMASPRHRDNILNPNFSRLGVGVALGGSGLKYYTAVFAGP